MNFPSSIAHIPRAFASAKLAKYLPISIFQFYSFLRYSLNHIIQKIAKCKLERKYVVIYVG